MMLLKDHKIENYIKYSLCNNKIQKRFVIIIASKIQGEAAKEIIVKSSLLFQLINKNQQLSSKHLEMIKLAAIYGHHVSPNMMIIGGENRCLFQGDNKPKIPYLPKSICNDIYTAPSNLLSREPGVNGIMINNVLSELHSRLYPNFDVSAEIRKLSFWHNVTKSQPNPDLTLDLKEDNSFTKGIDQKSSLGNIRPNEVVFWDSKLMQKQKILNALEKQKDFMERQAWCNGELRIQYLNAYSQMETNIIEDNLSPQNAAELIRNIRLLFKYNVPLPTIFYTMTDSAFTPEAREMLKDTVERLDNFYDKNKSFIFRDKNNIDLPDNYNQNNLVEQVIKTSDRYDNDPSFLNKIDLEIFS